MELEDGPCRHAVKRFSIHCLAGNSSRQRGQAASESRALPTVRQYVYQPAFSRKSLLRARLSFKSTRTRNFALGIWSISVACEDCATYRAVEAGHQIQRGSIGHRHTDFSGFCIGAGCMWHGLQRCRHRGRHCVQGRASGRPPPVRTRTGAEFDLGCRDCGRGGHQSAAQGFSISGAGAGFTTSELLRRCEHPSDGPLSRRLQWRSGRPSSRRAGSMFSPILQPPSKGSVHSTSFMPPARFSMCRTRLRP